MLRCLPLVLAALAAPALAQDPAPPDPFTPAVYTAYAEVGGNAAPISASLDVLLGGGYAFRVGGILTPFWEQTGGSRDAPEYELRTPPLATGTATLTRLFGGPRAFFEVGGGIMARHNRSASADAFPSAAGLTGVAGLRVQPERREVGVRIAFTPTLDRYGFHALVGLGLSYGLP